ncbi:MAG: hypothetical protein Q9194_007585 [Teloschistes cf. exilis]
MARELYRSNMGQPLLREALHFWSGRQGQPIWCCGSNNSACCGTPEAKWIVNGKVTSTNPNSIPKGSSSPSSTSSSSSATSSTSTSSSSSNSATAAAGQGASPTPGPDGEGTPVGAIAGGVFGGVVVLALLAGAIVFFRRRAKKDRQTHQQSHTSASNTHNHSPHAQTTSRAMSEAPPYGNKEPEKFRSEVAGTERYEMGPQAKEKPWRLELE